MKIDEFIEKVNERDGMRAKKTAEGIVIGTPNNMGIFNIPEDATNFIEIDTWATSNSLYWKKPDRECLSALIEEFLHTPIEERFPEKKYRLVAKRKIDQMPKYVKKIITGFDEFIIDFTNLKSKAMQYNNSDLKVLVEREPLLAPAIDAMKEPVEDE